MVDVCMRRFRRAKVAVPTSTQEASRPKAFCAAKVQHMRATLTHRSRRIDDQSRPLHACRQINPARTTALSARAFGLGPRRPKALDRPEPPGGCEVSQAQVKRLAGLDDISHTDVCGEGFLGQPPGPRPSCPPSVLIGALMSRRSWGAVAVASVLIFLAYFPDSADRPRPPEPGRLLPQRNGPLRRRGPYSGGRSVSSEGLPRCKQSKNSNRTSREQGLRSSRL